MPGIDSAVRTVTYAAQHTTANLGASATYTGPTIDGGADPETWPTRSRPAMRHLTSAKTAHAQLVLQESPDGTNWFETKSSPVPADGEVRSFDWPLHWRYHRYVVRNGAQAQTGMRLSSTASRGDGGTVDEHEVISFLVTNVPLAAGATFTSQTYDLGANSARNLIRTVGRADQAGGHFRVEWSDDGTTWQFGTDVISTTAAAATQTIEGKVWSRYFRIVWINGAAAMSSFRILASIVSL